MRILPGQTFKHFKGDVYRIIAVSELGVDEALALRPLQATHTEIEGKVLDFLATDDGRAWPIFDTEEVFVIYQKDGDEMPWARPIDMFLGEKSPGVYRFALYTPGSNAAIADGCTCAVMDNGHGYQDPRWMVVNMDCSIHGEKTA